MRAEKKGKRRAIFGVTAVALALILSACGKKMMMDPVMMALSSPGVRTVVIPKQHNDLTIIVPPCSEAAVVQSGSKPPAGSNRLVIPRASLTQTVAVNPCMMMMMMPMMMMGGMPISSTVLVTPGSGPAQPQSSGAGMMSMMPQDQLVLPTNSKVKTVIVPPCTAMMMMGKMMPMMGSPPSRSQALPTASDTVTAPPCMAMMM